jgi:hypothetical protein
MIEGTAEPIDCVSRRTEKAVDHADVGERDNHDAAAPQLRDSARAAPSSRRRRR